MSDTIRLIAEFFAACVGTIAFALLFHPSVAQLCGVQALPGNGISDCGYFPAGAGKRHLLDCFLRGNQ